MFERFQTTCSKFPIYIHLEQTQFYESKRHFICYRNDDLLSMVCSSPLSLTCQTRNCLHAVHVACFARSFSPLHNFNFWFLSFSVTLLQNMIVEILTLSNPGRLNVVPGPNRLLKLFWKSATHTYMHTKTLFSTPNLVTLYRVMFSLLPSHVLSIT